MKTRNVDKNWDWCWGHSTTDYVKNADSVALDIKMSLQEWYRDCFFAMQRGIAWDVRLGSHNQKKLLDGDIYKVVAAVDGVIRIFNFQSYVVDRHYSCSFDVYHIYSPNPIPITFTTEQING